MALANIKYKDTILKEVVRIQRWFRHIRSKFIFKFILNKAKDKHKARLRQFMDEIEGDLLLEQTQHQVREANNLEARNRERERDEQLKRELMAKRKAKATILFENSLAQSVEKSLRRACLKAF
jgi:hypothetical protein